ncbi:uncharacterized protein DS421_1g19230 [Arachis hypogaea]|nr:uncharacterized protein DS421_1g19230 [Arachis hypogaea]
MRRKVEEGHKNEAQSARWIKQNRPLPAPSLSKSKCLSTVSKTHPIIPKVKKKM